MRFLVITKPRAAFEADGFPDDSGDLEAQEQIQARKLYSDGSLRQVWALVREGRGAAVLLEADSPEALHTIWNTFPLVEAGYTSHEILQLAPYPGLAHPQL